MALPASGWSTGNIVHATDTTGIVVVTQLQPVSVVFTLPEDDLQSVSQAMAQGPVAVAARSRDGKTELDRGSLLLIDNQIDQTTGTIRLKATFPNPRNALWPGQFVNVRLLLQTEHNVLTVPSAAIERGPNGLFTYVIKPDSTIEMRTVTVGHDAGAVSVVASGLAQGDRVVTAGQYRVQPGAVVQIGTASSATPAAQQNVALGRAGHHHRAARHQQICRPSAVALARPHHGVAPGDCAAAADPRRGHAAVAERGTGAGLRHSPDPGAQGPVL
jgi:multidrug efflux system membrane fusion protein